MTWRYVADGITPNEQEVVEVQQTNGARQIACYMEGVWRIPAVDMSQNDQDMSEIRNVVKWRPFADVVASYEAKKAPYQKRPEW